MIAPPFFHKQDDERLDDFEAIAGVAVRFGGPDSDITNTITWAVKFIGDVIKRRHQGYAAPRGYRPIEELPDVVRRDAVLWNPCNGPHLERLTLEGDAARQREDGVWTHFLLLPDYDDVEAEERDVRIKDLLEANNRYLQRARDAEARERQLIADLKAAEAGDLGS